MERATACKAAGNAAFGAGDWQAAVEAYTAGLDAVTLASAGEATHGVAATAGGDGDVRALRATLFSNRAMCQLKRHDFGAAVADATAALATGHADGQEKALYRRAMVRPCTCTVVPCPIAVS